MTRKLPSLKAAYWAWLGLYMAGAAYNLITGHFQHTISRFIAQAGALPDGLTPERLVQIAIAASLAVVAVYVFIAGLLVRKALQHRKWAVWGLTVLGLLVVINFVYSAVALSHAHQIPIGVGRWILGTTSAAIWLYIIFAAHRLKPGHADWPEDNEPKRKLRQMLRNLGQGVRGALFIPLSPARVSATWGQLLGLAALAIPLQFIVDFIRVGPEGEFRSYGLPGVLFTLPLVLLAAWAAAARAKRPNQVLVLAVVLSAIGLVLNAVSPLVHWVLESAAVRGSFSYAWTVDYYFAAVWFGLAGGIAAARLVGATRLQRVSAFLAAGLLIGVPLSQVYANKTIWLKPYDREAYQRESARRHVLESEDIFYLQPKLLKRELAAVKPGPRNRINLYFVGVAGYGGQNVFMREVNYIDRMFAKRYGTATRSVELINNPDTVGDVPLASVTSLGRSLNRIGKVMNKDRDILFLYLTSHGSRDHEFALDFGAMHFNVLNPFRLRELLDASGIKRRVIVISACYSGGFIDALKDDNTLVITAAAADRTSFGCSNEANFTYFGRAYFRDSLAHTASFIQAFNLAKPMIAKWEDADRERHSNPQIYVGAKIKEALKAFAAQPAPPRHLAETPHADATTTADDLTSLRLRALMGDDNAQSALGWRYQAGKGVKRDYARGVPWLQKSAAQGNRRAIANLGWTYEYGLGVKQDYAKARYLFQQAASRSDAYALTSLGGMYENGMGVPRDNAKAVAYYRKAAALNDERGQVRMGDAYHRGSGVAKDDAKALAWYRKAAAHGTADGYNALGYFMLERGEHLPEAMGYVKKALKMAPNNPAIMDSLGWGYYRTGKVAQARTLLKRAYAGMKSPIIAAHLGEVLWVGGDRAQARKIWRAAMKVHPKDPTLTATMKKFGA